MTERRQRIYEIVADCLWRDNAPDSLVARISDALHRAEPYEFKPRDFLERAYGIDAPHP